MACPGELPVYHALPGPLATQQGALVGNDGVGPATGKTFRFSSTIAKLSTLWAGVNPRMSPQNASPSGTVLALLGSMTVAIAPLRSPSCARGSCRTEPDVKVTAAQLFPTAICAAEGSVRPTTPPSTVPDGHA